MITISKADFKLILKGLVSLENDMLEDDPLYDYTLDLISRIENLIDNLENQTNEASNDTEGHSENVQERHSEGSGSDNRNDDRKG